MHIYALEAINIPKMDLMSKSDPYVIFRFEKDLIGARTKYLDDTLTPQWNQLVNLYITDKNEDLIIEIWDKNIKNDKIICSSKINIQKYLNGQVFYEWIKMGKIAINLVIQVKQDGQSFISSEEVDKYNSEIIIEIQ